MEMIPGQALNFSEIVIVGMAMLEPAIKFKLGGNAHRQQMCKFDNVNITAMTYRSIKSLSF